MIGFFCLGSGVGISVIVSFLSEEIAFRVFFFWMVGLEVQFSLGRADFFCKFETGM